MDVKPTPQNTLVNIGISHRATLISAREKSHACANPLFLGPHPDDLPEHNDEWDGEHRFGIFGSSHLLKYDGSYFQIFTRHQVMDFDGSVKGSPYLLVSDTSDRIIGSNGFRSFSENDEEHFDLAAIKYDEQQILKHNGLVDRFFPVEDKFIHPNSDLEDVWTIVGHPDVGCTYDTDDGVPTFNQSFMELAATPTEESRKDAKPICTLKLFDAENGKFPLGGNYRGLSGSPVFAWSANRLDLHYRGMVITGGNQIVRLIREGAIIQFLKKL